MSYSNTFGNNSCCSSWRPSDTNGRRNTYNSCTNSNGCKIGEIFGISLSESATKSILGVGVTQSAGRTLAANLIKAVPGAGTVIGGVISASTAAALTEALGWIIADDFYRISNGEDPENIIEATETLKNAFSGLRMHKK